MTLWLPPSVLEAEIDQARDRYADSQLAAARMWTRELKRIDPHLELVWVNENATEPDLEPGRWHVRRKNPETLDTYYPLVGDKGEYREPGDWILDEMRAGDLWNPRVHRDKEEAKRRLREARTRASKLRAEQRQDEMAVSERAARRLRGESQFRRNYSKWGRPEDAAA